MHNVTIIGSNTVAAILSPFLPHCDIEVVSNKLSSNATDGHMPDMVLLPIDSPTHPLIYLDKKRRLSDKEIAVIFYTYKPYISHTYQFALRNNARDIIQLNDGANIEFVLSRELKTLPYLSQTLPSSPKASENKQNNEVNCCPDSNEDNIIEAVTAAIEHGRFHIELQPIASVSDIEHPFIYEIFSRLVNAEGALIYPEHFLPVAEMIGKMPHFDALVVNRAVKTIRFHTKRDKKIRLFINISATSLVSEKFKDHLLKVFMRAELPPGTITLEVSYETFTHHFEELQVFQKNMEGTGVLFSIEHIKNNQDTIDKLCEMPIDYIKLSHSLINKLNTNTLSDVVNIVEHAKKHDITVIAYGVERADYLASLYSSGIEYAQGYVIGRPHREVVGKDISAIKMSAQQNYCAFN